MKWFKYVGLYSILSWKAEQLLVKGTGIYVNILLSCPMTHLQKFRQQRGLSFRTLGVMAGVHSVLLVWLEAGKFDSRLCLLRKLAQALEVSVRDRLINH